MIISFAWTTPALLAGEKTVTRRAWTPEHAARFREGDLVDAWNRSPRVGRSRGARKVATIRLTRDPWLQHTDEMRPEDFRREGFRWLREHGEAETVDRITALWRDAPATLFVVEFELGQVFEG